MKNVMLGVQLNLDSMPGDMHTPESAQQIVEVLLNGMMPHYNPTVSVIAVSDSEVVANPYARHEMNWDKNGSGLCKELVARPDGRQSQFCNETYDSAIHGGSRDYDLPEQLPPNSKE